MIRAILPPPAPPKRADRTLYEHDSEVKYVTQQLARRLVRLCYQVARGNVSQATVEEARRLEFVIRDRKHAEVKAGRARYMRAWRERRAA